MSNQLAENKMGTMPIGKLLFNMAGPIIISMLVQALYNIVDSIFVAKISEDALAALSMAFPMQNLMIAAASGIGVGISALISRSLGQRMRDKAEHIAMQGILLQLCAYLVFLFIGLFAARSFIATQTTIESIRDYGGIYLNVVCCFSFPLFLQICFERVLQSTGRSMYSMITQLTGAVINIVLDPILIFGLFGMPAMGVMGAAIATVVGQFIAAVVAFILIMKKTPELTLHLHLIKPNGHMLAQILEIGIPSVLMVAIGSVMIFFVNKILGNFTSTAVAVFGVYFKLQSFIFMPIFGLNSGMVPIMSYNYGARHKDRMMKTIKLGMITAECIMILGFAAFMLAPQLMLTMFDASEDMLAIGVPALRIMGVGFLIAGICVVGASICQALNKSMYSLFISVGRQLVVLLPVAYVLAYFGGLAYVWWAWPIAEVASLVLSTYYVRRTLKHLDWSENTNKQ